MPINGNMVILYTGVGNKNMLKYEIRRKNTGGNNSIVFLRHRTEHRKDSPAYINSEGYLAWWEYGHRHRIDYPAIEWKLHNTTQYWIRGNRQC